MSRVSVAILGATGLVSQRMQQRLSLHPWFELSAVAGQSFGGKLSDVQWHLEQVRPKFISESNIVIKNINSAILAKEFVNEGIKIVFSALPRQPALGIEKQLVDAGLHVFSNASAYRMHPDVPLVVADLNPDDLYIPSLNRGMHACATNCTLIPLIHPLSLLNKRFDIAKVIVRSEQALSGAGWKLLHEQPLRERAIGKEIEGEAQKIIEEAERILAINDVVWDVRCTRVDEQDGHIVNVEVHLDNKITYDEVMSTLSSSNPSLPLPSQPIHAMELIDTQPFRKQFLWNGQTMEPLQPSKDLKAGMTTSVQLQSVEDGCLVFSALSHNTIRGAAGGVVLLAELAVYNNMLASVDINPSSSPLES